MKSSEVHSRALAYMQSKNMKLKAYTIPQREIQVELEDRVNTEIDSVMNVSDLVFQNNANFVSEMLKGYKKLEIVEELSNNLIPGKMHVTEDDVLVMQKNDFTKLCTKMLWNDHEAVSEFINSLQDQNKVVTFTLD